MVQWTPNIEALFFKVVLKIHDVKVDCKKAEAALREEGVDVTAKALMHRVSKLKNTTVDSAEPGKASPLKAAKRAANGKPKTVIPDPKGSGDDEDDTEVEQPKAKKPRITKVPVSNGNGNVKGKVTAAKGKKVSKKEEHEVEDEDILGDGAADGEQSDEVAI